MLSLTSPTFIPLRVLPSAGPPPARGPPFSRCPINRLASPRRFLPSGGSHTGVFPPPVPVSPFPNPFLLVSGPSPARRVPQLHRLHGAAGSGPNPLTAPSSPGTSPSPPHRPSHTSAFRPYRKRCEVRGPGRGRVGGPKSRDDGLSHVVLQGADSDCRVKKALSVPSQARDSMLFRCEAVCPRRSVSRPGIHQRRFLPLISQMEMLRLLRRAGKYDYWEALLQELLGRYWWFSDFNTWLNSCCRWRLDPANALLECHRASACKLLHPLS